MLVVMLMTDRHTVHSNRRIAWSWL